MQEWAASQLYQSCQNSGHFQKSLAATLVEVCIAQGVSPQLSLAALD